MEDGVVQSTLGSSRLKTMTESGMDREPLRLAW